MVVGTCSDESRRVSQITSSREPFAMPYRGKCKYNASFLEFALTAILSQLESELLVPI
jgi:hypothetical protein